AVPRHELLHVATRLGADVAFFASGAPAALAWGRGERLFRLPAPPAAPALVALALPPIAVATPDAYGWWDEMHPEPAPRGPLLLDADAFTGWGSLGRLGGNDFELPVFGKHPPLRALYERLAGTHPYWVRLCGSGSAASGVVARGETGAPLLSLRVACRRPAPQLTPQMSSGQNFRAPYSFM